MSFKNIFYLFVLIFSAGSGAPLEITSMTELKAAIIKGPNRKVGFAQEYKVGPVLHLLPANTDIVVCGLKHPRVTCNNMTHIYDLVKDGTLLAGIAENTSISALKNNWNVFSSGAIVPQVTLMSNDNSSRDLSRAINAVIVILQNKGIDQKLKREYTETDTEHAAIKTCKSGRDVFQTFPVPNKGQATGLLRKVLDTKVLKTSIHEYVLRSELNIFWPSLVRAILNELNNLSGPDGELYGPGIRMEGHFGIMSNIEQIRSVLNGHNYMSAPWHEMDELYVGTQEPCRNNSDCRATQLSGGSELCMEHTAPYGEALDSPPVDSPTKRCTHPPRFMMDVVWYSCSLIAVEPHFFSRKLSSNSNNNSRKMSYLTMGIAMGVPIVAVIAFLITLSVLIHFERKGRPLYLR